MTKIKILMADDHPVVRAGIRGMLETQDEFQVIAEAENGREAIEQAQQLRPDVVIMDINMPDMDGISATEAIRKKALAQQINQLSFRLAGNRRRI